MFEIEPLGVVVPEGERDLVRLVEYCGRHGIPITGRGAGSSVAGAAVGSGIIVDFSRRMNRILDIDPDRGWVRIQPRVVLADLNRELASKDYFFPPDPASASFCTVGGMIQTNAGGVHSLKYGTTRDYILELGAVLDTGDTARIRTEKENARFEGRYGEIFGGTLRCLGDNAALSARYEPRAPKNSSGYHVYDVRRDGVARLQRLVSGSEGTLCLVSEAKLSIRKRPRNRLLCMMVFPNLRAACAHTETILSLEPAALELMDRTAVRYVLKFRPAYATTLGRRDAAVVYCEFEGDDPRDLRARARKLKRWCPNVKALEEEKAEALWQIRRAVSPALERVKGGSRSTRVVEDACVEPGRVAEYVEGLQRILRSHRTPVAVFGHLGSGNIHANVFLDLRRPDHVERLQTIGFEVAELVHGLRGTLSGEHGDGLLRAPHLREQFGELYGVFEEIKRIWDPRGMFNPGKKLAPKGYRYVQDLRGTRRPGFAPSGPLKPVATELLRCNGCTKCHHYCPLFRETPDEYSAPRAKVNLLLAAMQQRIPLEEVLGAPLARRHFETCLTCGKCSTDCPAGTDLTAIARRALELGE
jgi:FAD/FMN-containing dehydrogenase